MHVSVSVHTCTCARTGILPVPNLPFYWNVYRIYCNWRAARGGEQLDALLGDERKSNTEDEDAATVSGRDAALVAADETSGVSLGDTSADVEDDDNADLQPCSRADCCMQHFEVQGDDPRSWGRTKRDTIKLVACEWLDAVARPRNRMRSALSDARAGLVSRQFNLMPLDETLARLRYAVQAQREHT